MLLSCKQVERAAGRGHQWGALGLLNSSLLASMWMHVNIEILKLHGPVSLLPFNDR